MRSLAFAIISLLALGAAQGYPLHGGNGAVNCTLFGAMKIPLEGADQSSGSKELALKVDVGLIGASNATFELVDDKDRIYRADKNLSRSLQPGRYLLVFVVPREALFKLFKIHPSKGKSFAINWWRTPKRMNGDVVLRYYGVVDSDADPDQQLLTFEVGIANDGTAKLPISPENFTLLDQWGWEYYTLEGFGAVELEPKKAVKVMLRFGELSPLSRPKALVYDYLTERQIVIEMEKDLEPLPDALVYGTNVPQPPPALSVAPPSSGEGSKDGPQNNKSRSSISSLKGEIAATKARLENVGGQPAAKKKSSLKEDINAAKVRLDKVGKSGGSKTSTNTSSKIEEASEKLAQVRRSA
jgi:hypothetical protein